MRVGGGGGSLASWLCAALDVFDGGAAGAAVCLAAGVVRSGVRVGFTAVRGAEVDLCGAGDGAAVTPCDFVMGSVVASDATSSWPSVESRSSSSSSS